ncbi:hypothetical protein G6F40_015754 [Rhizopus arrhizus]|nr:hypothetical protein G6F40_015754 [Rhizopus arrhizus]
MRNPGGLHPPCDHRRQHRQAAGDRQAQDITGVRRGFHEQREQRTGHRQRGGHRQRLAQLQGRGVGALLMRRRQRKRQHRQAGVDHAHPEAGQGPADQRHRQWHGVEQHCQGGDDADRHHRRTHAQQLLARPAALLVALQP